MSNYTSQLRYICESFSGFTSEELLHKSIDEIINAAKGKIFNFTFPIYDERYRATLEHEILFHFYAREIGSESYGLFNYYLARKLREIMPYYNQLYASAELEFNPFYDVDYTETHEETATGNKNKSDTANISSIVNGSSTQNGTVDGETSGTTTINNEDTSNVTTNSTADGTATGEDTNSKNSTTDYSESNVNRDAYSDTPQTSISGVEGSNENYYLTNYRKKTDSKSGENTVNDNSTSNSSSSTHSETGTTTNGSNTSNSVNENSETSHSESANTMTAHNETTGRNTSNGTEEFNNTIDYTNRYIGKRGGASYAALLKEYRDTMININSMIFEELECCFMNIF